MRPKLRTFIPDVYRDVSYVLDEDSYAVAEYNDIVRKRFIKAWENLVDGYKVSTCEYHSFHRTLVLLRDRIHSQKTITGCSLV